MVNRSTYQYKTFSKRLRNMSDLYQHEIDISSFHKEYFGDPITNMKSYLEDSFDGAVLAFGAQKTIGFMSFFQLGQSNSFEVGFTFVHQDYRRQGVWLNMSRLVENESKAMGAEKLLREISEINIATYLLKIGYRAEEGSDPNNWRNYRLVMRL